jgi:hypothetical protein
MPIFEIQGADGQVYEVEAPDENSAASAFQSQFQPQPATATDSAPSWAQTIDSFGRGIVNGATFGFGDNLGAGARWLGGQVGLQPELTYDQALQEVKSQDQAVANAAPVSNIAGNITGAVGTALRIPSLAGTVAGSAGGLGGIAARTGLAGVEGAGYGSLTALGNDQDVSTGALLGGALGLGGNLLGEGTQAVVNALRGPEARAAEYVSRAAQMDGLTPQSGAARLSELGPEGVLADLGPNMSMQARGAYTRPGEAQTVIRDALVNRGNQAGQRIEGSVNQSLGAQSDVLQTADDIISARRAVAKPLYDIALPTPVPPSDELTSLLQRPSAQAALKQAQNNILDRGGVFDIKNPTVELLDEVKKALDDVIEPARRAGEGAKVSTLTTLKNDIVKFADNVSQEYAQARQAFQGPTQVINALEDGQKVFSNSLTPQQLSRDLAALDDASREAYVQGARQQVRNVMGTARNDANAARSLFDKGYNREKLTLLLGAEEANNLIRSIDAENAFVGTRGAVLGGSNTVPSANAGDLVAGGNSSPGFFRNFANFNYGDAASQVADSLLGGAMGTRNANTNREIARLLMSQNAGALSPTQVPTAVRDAIVRSLISGGTNQVTGQ